MGLFRNIFGGTPPQSNLPVSSGLYPSGTSSIILSNSSGQVAGNYGGFSQQAGMNAMGSGYYGQSNAANQMAAMQMAQAGQWIPDRPRTTVTIDSIGCAHIEDGHVIHDTNNMGGLIVMSDLYLHTDIGVSLHNIERIIKSVHGTISCSPYVTNMLGLLLIEDVVGFNMESMALGPNDGEALTRLFNKYKGTGDIIALQDELIDAGLTNQARL
jgi:hypothetical protein